MIIEFPETDCKTGELKTTDDMIIYSANTLMEGFKIIIFPKDSFKDIVLDNNKYKQVLNKMQNISCHLKDYYQNGLIFTSNENSTGIFNSATIDLYIMSINETEKYERIVNQIIDNVHLVKASNINIEETENSYIISNNETKIKLFKDNLFCYDICKVKEYIFSNNENDIKNCINNKLIKTMKLYNIFISQLFQINQIDDIKDIL